MNEITTKNKPEIIYQDDFIIVVNKPPHLLAIPDRYETTKANVLQWLRGQFENVFTVHRIDKETSGVMIFARDEVSHKDLSQQFEKRKTVKIYQALVEGTLKEKAGIIDAPLLNNLSSSGKVVVHKTGKPSESHYTLIEQFRDFALVEFDIKTGRTHQIRVHTKHLGYPLMTDPIYGKRSEFFLSQVKKKKYSKGKHQEERPLLTRSSLHAARLTIEHPDTKEKTTFEASLPKDMNATLNQLRKWN